MARIRSIRNRTKRGKKEVMDIDITSLLDILVILLVFLVMNYNAGGIEMVIPEGITLPNSTSKNINKPGVQIQVSPSKIWVDGKEVLSSENMPGRVYDQGGKRIIPLYDELVKIKEQVKNLAAQTEKANEFSGTANLVVDKTLKYSYVKKLMYTCAEAGFQKFQLVVLGEQE